jgi:pimeloyl-ACP methyl ester carboxylesterase
MSLFCLVHGSTQNAEGWKLLIPELEKSGHYTLTLNLPADEPQASATRYADLIVEALDQTDYDLNQVVVVAHSASGVFLPLVAARRPIGHMVFLAALVPKIGTSILEQIKSDRGMFNPEWIGKNPVTDEAVAKQFLFHDCPPERLGWALATRRLTHAKAAMAEVCPLTAWPNVKGTSLVCTQDRILMPSWSRRVARERLGSEPIELEAGHCPYVSQPSALARALIRAAAVKNHSV